MSCMGRVFAAIAIGLLSFGIAVETNIFISVMITIFIFIPLYLYVDKDIKNTGS